MTLLWNFLKTIRPNYKRYVAQVRAGKIIAGAQKKYILTQEDFQKLMALSEKRHQADIELGKFWKKVGDKMGFDYRTAHGVHPHPSPELMAMPIEKVELKPA